MKKTDLLKMAAVAGALCLLPGPTTAQTNDAPTMDTAPIGSHRHEPGGLMGTLNLTADQKARMKEIRRKYRESESSGKPETPRQLQEEIRGVLTPAQRTQLAAELKARRAARAQHSASN